MTQVRTIKGERSYAQIAARARNDVRVDVDCC